MKSRHIFSIIVFLFKTVYFSPVNNPSVFLLGLMVVVLLFTGDIGKHETLLLMLVVGISNRFMPAFKGNADNYESTNTTISHYSRLLPIEKGTFFIGYFITGLLYVSLLLSLCLYIGINHENPPVIASICPPQTIKAINPHSNESFTTVVGVISTPDSANNLRPVKFTIPVSSSIIFGNLASTVHVWNKKLPDSVFCSLCPPQHTEELKENFSLFSFHGNSQYFSDFLGTLPNAHYKILLLIVFLCLLIFLLDLIKIYHKDTQGFPLVKIMDLCLYVPYFCLCIALLFDLILPESIIHYISSIFSHFKLFAVYGYYSILFIGSCRILSFLTLQFK